MNGRYALAASLFAAFLLTALPTATAQTRRTARLPRFSARPVCAEEAGDPPANTGSVQLSFISYLRTEGECGGAQGEARSFAPDPPPASARLFSERDPVENELNQLGAAGYAVAVVRQHVLAILEDKNSCSAWYAQAEPDPRQKFASLRFEIDPAGEDSAVGEAQHWGMIFREPYVARTQQEVAAGSTITLNSNGAFFVSEAPAKIRPNGGGPLILEPYRRLHVGGYDGGSLSAQLTTMLHEYGHIVGLLPVDLGEASSAMLSTRNTETVLEHCHRQIEAAGNRAVVLPLSLAVADRGGKKR